MILISGIGLLLLSMTNRLARVIDRTRFLAADRRPPGAEEPEELAGQFRILHRRSRLLRRAILLASVSVLMVALLIIVLFLTELLGSEMVWAIILLFVASMVSLVGSLIAFIQDVYLSLEALDLVVARR